MEFSRMHASTKGNLILQVMPLCSKGLVMKTLTLTSANVHSHLTVCLFHTDPIPILDNTSLSLTLHLPWPCICHGHGSQRMGNGSTLSKVSIIAA